MAEKPVVGGIVGPTFSCILGQQFLNLRKGDRFWYENGDHPGAFTPSQLQEIRKTSLARVICDCLDDIDMLQPFAFLQPDQFANQRTVCKGQGALYFYIYTLLVCLSVCLFIRLYPMNIKTVEPIQPKFCAGPYMTPGKVYECSKSQKFVPKSF